jgi:DNA repair photolyase
VYSLLVERDTDAKCQIVTQWPIDSLQSCEHPTLCQVTLTFDTVRRDKERRDYTLEASEVQVLLISLH